MGLPVVSRWRALRRPSVTFSIWAADSADEPENNKHLHRWCIYTRTTTSITDFAAEPSFGTFNRSSHLTG